jgi:hypothetical protein
MAGTCRCYRVEAWLTEREPPMSMLEFYDYLVSSDATHDLALHLADVWADRELPVLEQVS